VRIFHRLFAGGSLPESLSRALSRPGAGLETLSTVEQTLIEADLGCDLTDRILDGLREGRISADHWRRDVADILLAGLPARRAPLEPPPVPLVSMFIGVNGSGKTTTIARLGWRARGAGSRPLLSCADTFRAAASEQLALWGERLGLEVFCGRPGADPGSVAYDSICRARSAGHDRVLIDTAGRLPNKAGLLDELAKVRRVCGKAMEGAPHEIMLVLDASVGQNALSQGRRFAGALPLTGLVLTKLDGTARGGSVLALSSSLGVPIEFVGTGEAEDDMIPFDAGEFVSAILEGPGD